MDSLEEKVIDKINLYLKANKITVIKLSKMTEIDYQRLKRILNNKTSIELDELADVAVALDKRIDYFF